MTKERKMKGIILLEQIVELTEEKDNIYHAVNILDIIENMLKDTPFDNIRDERVNKKTEQLLTEIKSMQLLLNSLLNENYDKMRELRKNVVTEGTK